MRNRDAGCPPNNDDKNQAGGMRDENDMVGRTAVIGVLDERFRAESR